MMMADSSGIAANSSAYAYSSNWNDELWIEWYTRGLAPCNEIIRLTENDPFLVNKKAIARIWRAYLFHRITGLIWGYSLFRGRFKVPLRMGDAILTPKIR